jgi:hypothetical protein
VEEGRVEGRSRLSPSPMLVRVENPYFFLAFNEISPVFLLDYGFFLTFDVVKMALKE